jgi:hypothetical protein
MNMDTELPQDQSGMIMLRVLLPLMPLHARMIWFMHYNRSSEGAHRDGYQDLGSTVGELTFHHTEISPILMYIRDSPKIEFLFS